MLEALAAVARIIMLTHPRSGVCVFGKGRGLISLSICLPVLENGVSKGFHELGIIRVRLVKSSLLCPYLNNDLFHLVAVWQGLQMICLLAFLWSGQEVAVVCSVDH